MDSKNLKAMKNNYIAPTIKVLLMNTVVNLAGSNPYWNFSLRGRG